MATTLTIELWTRIAHFLDIENLKNFTLTCRQFHELSNSDAYWIDRAIFHDREEVLPSLEWRRAVSRKQINGQEIDELHFDYKTMVLSDRGYSLIILDFTPYITSNRSHEYPFVLRKIRTDSIRISGRMSVENGGIGSVAHPDVTQCIGCSWGKLRHCIDLVKSGIDPWVMDYVRPKIVVTQKVAQRWDCGAKIKVEMQLSSTNKLEMGREGSYQVVRKRWRQWGPAEWEDMKVELEGYGLGMRYLMIDITGRDTQNWAGFYGPKFANLKVQVVLPDVPVIKPL